MLTLTEKHQGLKDLSSKSRAETKRTRKNYNFNSIAPLITLTRTAYSKFCKILSPTAPE